MLEDKTKSYHYKNNMQTFSSVVSVNGKQEQLRPRNPQEIAEYVREEHTPYASCTTVEEADKHLADMIQRWADYYHDSLLFPLTEDGERKE